MSDQLMTTDDVVQLLQVKKSWIYDQVERGNFPGYKVGNHLRFRRSEVDQYLEECRTRKA